MVRTGLVALCGVAAAGSVGLRAIGPDSSVIDSDGAPHGYRADTDPQLTDLETRYRDHIAPILASHCLRCHGPDQAKSGVRFDGLGSIGEFLELADDFEIARDLVEFGDMPPSDEPRPSDEEREVLLAWFDDVLAHTPEADSIDPGWFTIHRLNRMEYRNTVRDLLGVDPSGIDIAASLPADDTGYGFDNIADVLTMSPLHLELYLDAAERAIEVGLGPVVEVGTEPEAILPLEVTRQARPLSSGGYFLTTNAEVFAIREIPATGDYEVVVEAFGTRGGDELPRLSVRIDGEEIGEFFVEAERGDVQVCRVPVRLKAGATRISAAFTNDYWVPSRADRNLAIDAISLAGPLTEETLERPDAYHEVFFATPGPGANETAERDVARMLIARFAARAFRRPIAPEEMRRLMRLYETARREGDAFEHAVRLVMSAALVSPNFLYRSVDNAHAEDAGRVHALTGYELASRLSYFLWSSMPDDELFDLADSGLLEDEFVLRLQASRMLADPRADAFIENFAGQWLHLRNLDRLEIDPETYPEFTPALREDMRTEAMLFFGDVVRSDRSVVDLIAGRDTFVNARLADHYGLPAPASGTDGFQRVSLPEGSARGGVLTMGAVLAVTSNPTRTSPVKRGLYVLDQLLGEPPPPPPPDIPRLEQSASVLPEDATPRQKLAAHLTDPTCVTCHRRMDPIGLAMENFDAIGRWRDDEHGREIDASGELPGGVRFDGPAELKQILLAREDDFVDNLTRQVLTYALGRGLEPFDRPTVGEIVDEVRQDGHTFGALVEAVVVSPAFRSCRARDEASTEESKP